MSVKAESLVLRGKMQHRMEIDIRVNAAKERSRKESNGRREARLFKCLRRSSLENVT